MNEYSYYCRCKILGIRGAVSPGRKILPTDKIILSKCKIFSLRKGGGRFKTFFQNEHFEEWGVFLKGGFLVIPTD